MSGRILVIEDEVAIAQAVTARLRSEGFDVVHAADGPEGVALCRSTAPDLVVLDLMLPGLDGWEVCRQIQRDRHVAVLMLTAKDAEEDLVLGLRLGADDYMTKPFSPRELVARVHAIMRRVREPMATDPAPGGEIRLRVDGVDTALDVAGRRVHRAGDAVHLTPTEFDLLLALVRAEGAVLSRERLLTEVWGYRDGTGARTVDSHVRSLRRKLGDGLVRTVHAVGYALGDVVA
ncbi:response regulator transcription factor [Actinomarinicola tropica]|uniref:Response regulator n=1 Tax=Actinomarinicola tropica TaxID=2789776 RepID=A0A5Q2RI93_9ACTN|nr:response regulator transcription factor [Actinomarinicola tropica]QGG96509.1 response regulator [Actinomarinicola tropica]